MNQLLNDMPVFPDATVFETWQRDLCIKKGLFFELPIIRLAVMKTIESWTYLDLEQSFNMFKSCKGDWAIELSKQTLDDLYNECLTLKFLL